MNSNKLVLVFLGIIVVIIIILSSQKISNSLRARLGPYLPIKPAVSITPSPSPVKRVTYVTPTPVYNSFINTSSADNIPSTGPEIINYAALLGLLAGGVGLKLKKKN